MSSERSYLKKLYSKIPVIAFDTLAIPVAWCAAFWLQSKPSLGFVPLFGAHAIHAFLFLISVQVGAYYYFKVYRGLWRYASLSDVARVLRAVLFATVAVSPIFIFTEIFAPITCAILPVYGIFLLLLLCGGRILCRHYCDTYARKKDETLEIKRVLIIGAGQAGEGLVRDLKRSKSYLPVGLVDDNKSKRGLEVHGVRVLGTVPKLVELVRMHNIDMLFIAIPSAGSAAMRRIVRHCEMCKLPFNTLPSIHAVASGLVAVNALRKVHIEDLLGRDQVNLNWDAIALEIYNKRVMVTGAGGSIGSELCRQVMALQPATLIILDHSEYNLYAIEQDLRKNYPRIKIELALVSVTDEVAVNRVVQSFKPEIVFHAAAYKHVPMLETQIPVAIKNNIIGTQNMAKASALYSVEKFILISTDKAVNPTSVMGVSKRIAEIYCQNFNERVQTQFITVRFGNVLGSVGSVVPLFQQQLQAGGPLTVTHPDMQRYFMTIPEASQLILQAMTNGSGGEIFVLDMGDPIKISYLAEQMIRLAGKEPGTDIHIEYTGLRPGEKLFEELFHASEKLVPTAHEKLFRAQFRKMEWDKLTKYMQVINQACIHTAHDELFDVLKSIVPEFKSEKTRQDGVELEIL